MSDAASDAPTDALTAEEVALRLKISKSGVYALIKAGAIGHYKVGRKIRFSAAQLRAYVEGTACPAARPGPVVLEEGRHFDLGAQRPGSAGFVICGQDLILDVLSNLLRQRGVMALRAYIGSYDSLVSLYHDRVGVATAHLWDGASDSYNIAHVRALLPGIACTIVNVTWRMQGLYVAEGNPKRITGWADFGRDDIRMINREKGAGSRVLLDEHLRRLGISGSRIAGYGQESASHLALASAVGRGEADIAVGTEKIARQVDGVAFLPMQRERYDLVVKTDHLPRPEVQALLSVLRSQAFKAEFGAIGGYDLRDIGRVICET